MNERVLLGFRAVSGGTHLRSAAVDQQGKSSIRLKQSRLWRRRSDCSGAGERCARIRKQSSPTTEAPLSPGQRGFGVVPGTVNVEEGMVGKAPNLPVWMDAVWPGVDGKNSSDPRCWKTMRMPRL